MERKLAAIFSTDVTGYSRLMGDDEEATIQTLKTYRAVITGLIEQHHGRVVDSPGDNLLAEFASAVDAVKSAVAIQHELKIRNAELEAHRQMEFRIGLNVGDVITDEGRLYGDGVNIAARLEGLADPGGISISGNVHEQIRNKLTLAYAYIGEQAVKNIATPVPVYKVQLEADGKTPLIVSPLQSAVGSAETSISRRWPLATLAVVAVLLVGAEVTIFRFFLPQPSPPQPVLPVPDKPSIAVLPFTNMSGDSEQEYFSDGMTEDIITDLSKISGLFVIARNSVFTYKGQAVEVSEVGRTLGVRYVLEGSVRKADNRVRINAQLVDAATGGHIWAERYDRELKKVFALQDEITQQIVTMLRVEVQEAERERVRRIPTTTLTAHDAWLRGVEYYWRNTPEDNTRAQQLFERAIALDPQYADAYAWLGMSYYQEWGWWNPDPPLLARAEDLAQHALTLDDVLPTAHILLGYVYQYHKQQSEQAIAESERALALDPNWADAHAWLAEVLSTAGRPEEAIGFVQQAMRLNPRYPGYYPFILGRASTLAGQFDEAIVALQEALHLNPDDSSIHVWLAGNYLSQWAGQWSQDPQTLERAETAAHQAVALNGSTFWVRGMLMDVYLWQKRYEAAKLEAERALAFHTGVSSQVYMGRVLNFVGRPNKTIETLEQTSYSSAVIFPANCFLVLGGAYGLTGRPEEAIDAYHQALTHKPSAAQRLFSHLGLAALYSALGREEEARAEIGEVLNINPQFSLAGVQQRFPYKDPAVLERLLAALGKAGLQ